MTRKKILSLVPGRELDRLVAEEVMGWQLFNYETDLLAKKNSDWSSDGWKWEGRGGDNEAWEWMPSKHIDCAFEVIDKVYGMDYGKVRIEVSHYHGIHVWLDHGNDLNRPLGTELFTVELEEVPLLICRAALLATLNPTK